MKQLYCSIHQEEIEFICNFKGCNQPYLCLLCFQEHKKICPANYKTDIKKVYHHSSENQALKETAIAQIEALYQQKAQIHIENHQLATQKFTEIKQECEKHYSLWLKDIEGLDSLLSHHIHVDILDGIEKKFDEIKKLNFSQANNVKVSKMRRFL